jgi:tRNA-2-methylthio-N6-dimethylallyladenosine synthase
MVYSFQYSPRKGTPAAEMEEQISKEVKSERFDRLLKLQDSISLSSNQVLVGKTLRVLCDGPSKNNKEIFSGRTDGGKIVFFDGELDDIGQFVDINIEKGDTFALSGKIIRK